MVKEGSEGLQDEHGMLSGDIYNVVSIGATVVGRDERIHRYCAVWPGFSRKDWGIEHCEHDQTGLDGEVDKYTKC